jgi:hypothetical protein
MKKQVLFFCCALLLHIATKAQTNPVVVPGSQRHTITSKIVSGQDYELQVMLPGSYEKGNKTYPVLYLMDSQWDFPLVTALYGQQYYDGFIPEMIIVGITWAGPNANADSLRARDYTPTNDKRVPQSGGAANFLSFMKAEVFPFVESRFRADRNDRTLMGCSLGGLFTLYALFTEPGLFQRYVAAAPAVGWDNEALDRFEKQYAENKVSSPARLYACVGGVESNGPLFQKFMAQLTSRRYKNLQIQKQVLENIGHSGTKGEGYERGLQYAFERPKLKLTAAQLQALSGTYKAQNGMEVTIQPEGGSLVVSANSAFREKLYAASETELYATSGFLKLHFKKDESSKITGFEGERYGGSMLFQKKQ